MSEPTTSTTPLPLNPTHDAPPRAQIGGMLGVAACLTGLAIFLGGCMGFERAFDLARIPLALAAAGLLFTVLAGVFSRSTGVQHTGILASVLLNVFGIVGGILEWALGHGSTIFPPVK
jgi:hypothetical protein